MANKEIASNEPLVRFLNRVFETNEKFSSEHAEGFFDKFRDVQTPHLTILKCSDSRVQMESFDRTPQNGVFAIRNIGNQIATCEGSIEFGVRILKTPILMILGHSGCGAIEACLHKSEGLPDSINKELNNIAITEDNMPGAIIENIRNQVIVALEKYSDLVESGELTIIGAVYDFKNDFGFGKGRIVFTNINELSDPEKVKQAIGAKVPNMNFIE